MVMRLRFYVMHVCLMLVWQFPAAMCAEGTSGSCDMMYGVLCVRSEQEAGGVVASVLVGALGAGWVFPGSCFQRARSPWPLCVSGSCMQPL